MYFHIQIMSFFIFKLRKFEFSTDSGMKGSMESQTITCSFLFVRNCILFKNKLITSLSKWPWRSAAVDNKKQTNRSEKDLLSVVRS